MTKRQKGKHHKRSKTWHRRSEHRRFMRATRLMERAAKQLAKETAA